MPAGKIEETETCHLTNESEERHHWRILIVVGRKLFIEVCDRVVPS
jgi:hypothetical protein